MRWLMTGLSAMLDLATQSSSIQLLMAAASQKSKLLSPLVHTFSSMTCFSVDSASTSASARLMSFLYCSCRAVCAPSEPEPMAMQLYFTYVPDGSVWYLRNKTKQHHIMHELVCFY
eukprot:GHRR01014422.1.p1 GENE.GHRR01014422.1~~GHRR01014422.1.p1  ORF type:complete len:116 (-),score=23.02 GHRR01014422.1:1110-1457(-)